MSKPKSVVMVMPYRAEVALFDGYEAMEQYFKEEIKAPIHGGRASYGCAVWTTDDEGTKWFAISLEDKANFWTLLHECSHMVDFIFEVFGVPCGPENTEVRAYTLTELVGDVANEFGFEAGRN